MRRIITIGIICFSIVFFGLTCNKEIKSAENNLPLEAEIVLSDSAFALGASIDIDIVLKSTNNEDLQFEFANSCPFDAVISRHGIDVWQANANKACSQIIQSGKISPGDSTVHTVEWNCHSNLGKEIILGKYTVHGIIHTVPPITTEPVVFYLVD